MQRRPLNIRSDFSANEEALQTRTRRSRGYTPLVPRTSDDVSVALSLAQSTMNKGKILSPRQKRMIAEQEQKEREDRLRQKEEQIAEEVLKVHELQRQMAEQAMEYQKAQMQAMKNESSSQYPADISWLEDSNLPPEQIQLIIKAMKTQSQSTTVDCTESESNRKRKGFVEVMKQKPADDFSIPEGMEWLKTSGLSPEEMRVAIIAMNAKNGQGTFLGQVNTSASSMHDCSPAFSGGVPSGPVESLDPSIQETTTNTSFQEVKIEDDRRGGNFVDVVAPADLPEGYTFEAQGGMGSWKDGSATTECDAGTRRHSREQAIWDT